MAFRNREGDDEDDVTASYLLRVLGL